MSVLLVAVLRVVRAAVDDALKRVLSAMLVELARSVAGMVQPAPLLPPLLSGRLIFRILVFPKPWPLKRPETKGRVKRRRWRRDRRWRIRP
jgi:hypothetical protein